MEKASERVFDVLGLDPTKNINLNELITVSSSDVSEPLFKTLLRSLILLDYTCRDRVIDSFNKSDTDPNASLSTAEAFFSNPVKTDRLNPMDALLACFHCSDLVLKQVLMERLFLCKLAMPLIYTLQGYKERSNIFNLWAMRSIVATWQEEGRAVESTLVDYPLQMVTFMRLGVTTLSKSKLINEIIINGVHDTFFHRDCPQGVNKRVLSEGVVEAAFLLPNTAHPNILHPSVLCNLRGDASNLPNLVAALLNCSCKVFVFVSMGWISHEENRNTMTANIATNCYASKVHIMVTATPEDRLNPDHVNGYGYLLSILPKELPIDILCADILNKAQMKDLFLDRLKTLKQNHKPISIEDIAKTFGSSGYKTDEREDGGILFDCKKAAISFLDHCKDSFLPMQGEILEEIVSIVREGSKVRGKIRTPETVEMESTKIVELRGKQLNFFISNTDTLFSRFLRRLRMFPEDGDIPFALQIKWYRLQLAQYTRKKCLIPQHKYNAKLGALKEAKEKKEETKIKQITAEIAKLDQKLKNICFSLEHLFRELGQMYEALAAAHDRNQVPGINKKTLVDIGTRLVLNGNPIEIINGDCKHLHCPLEWIEAILKNVRSKCGDRKVFVLSILGIQSSGKSTLLNAMFGVQFAVSAGRCTRGIYMQLLKVAPTLPFDFVLVVDTEGLRDDTLLVSQVRHNHDNELATMAIGLGDVTLVNVKGENNAEINDVLQIAVQAFLRMKSVNSKIKLHQKCIFVHQNVGGEDAKEKLINDRRNLQQSLDTITEIAARQEGFSDITQFSDIIKFDYEKDVWYFPNLWFGNPPMAPLNPKYVDTVKKLKHNILSGEGISTERDILSFAEYEAKLRDLWMAIMSDDFVYSFRNSLELQCYSDLEVEFNKICWAFDSGINDFVSAAENKMAGASNEKILKQVYDGIIVDLDPLFSKLKTSGKKELEQIFETHVHKVVIAQWHSKRLKEFEDCVTRKKSKTDISLSCAMKDVELSLSDLYERGKLEAKLRALAELLAANNKTLESENPDAEDATAATRLVFDKEMHELLEQIRKELPVDRTDVEKDIQVVFMETIPESIKISVLTALNDKQYEEVGSTTACLVGAVGQVFVEKNDYARAKLYHILTDVFYGKEKEQNVIKEITRTLFKEIGRYIDDHVKTKKRFKSSHAAYVFQLIAKMFRETDEKYAKHEFKLTPHFHTKIYCIVFRFSTKRFLQMQSIYVEEHGIMKRLEEYRETAWILFRSLLKCAQEEEIAGDMFCERLKGLIKNFVNKQVYKNIECAICLTFPTKFGLIASSLEDLAQNDIFDDYVRYLSDPKEFCFNWMEKFVKFGLFGKLGENCSPAMINLWKATRHVSEFTGSAADKHNFASYAKFSLNKLIDKVVVLIEGIAENKCDGIDAFLAKVRCALQEIFPISPIDFDQVKDHRDIQDISNLCKNINTKLKRFRDQFQIYFDETTESSWMWGGELSTWHKKLDDLWGCEAICPFCGETCQFMKDHVVDHMCIQHRPKGLAKWRKHKSNILSSENCSFSISSEEYSFLCSPKKDRCVDCPPPVKEEVFHKYTDYRKYIPNWKIDPCPTNDNCKYWQWVLERHNDKFAKKYNCKPANIPERWKDITQDEAIQSLRELYRSPDN